ncbi:MAG: zinc ABC transporter substrate-binding protein [Desulfobulbaceae bacterium]|uniref:Zinc ABC transporter substrate-binding protein n=1 Tax=Candidatus Desulfobia pelagia TaxID=2841692 RepID=A0A8J6NFU9_9BACT|nr:zinc ABC transporter substrate-binding protein [Candidatus Desulfobia pelagia]
MLRFFHIAWLLVLVILLFLPSTSFAEIRVFACEPEWASLAKEIGGSKVETFTATHARQDPHYIRARPSLIAKMRKADLLVCSGAGLEAGWLPILFQKAGNAKLQPDKPGYLFAADIVPMLEKPILLDRSMGDVHPEGNPHVHLNPNNVLLVAKEMTKRLKLLDPSNAESYQSQFENFSKKWQNALSRWEQQVLNLKGKRIVTHHMSWSYFIDWIGLSLVNTLEPKPGIPATTNHLEALLQQVRNAPVLAIIRTPYAQDKASEWLSEKSGVPAIVLPYTIGGTNEVTDLFKLFDLSLQLLEEINNVKR